MTILRFCSEHAIMLTMIRTILSLFVCLCLTATLAAEVPNWTFTEEQLRLFNPPKDADAEKMLQWTNSLESPIPRDTEPYGGYDKYREHVQLMKIMACRAILATNPPFELEQTAWSGLWFPYYLLTLENRDEWLPKMKEVYDELIVLSRKKGEVLDQQTVLYLSRREAFFRSIIGNDKNFLSNGDELLNEIGNFIKKHRIFDHLMNGLYGAKSGVLRTMGGVDEKYQQMLAAFNAEMKELVIQNENSLQSPVWYHLFYPESPYDAEKQAEAHRLIEKMQNLIDTNEETNRFDTEGVRWLYRHQTRLFSSLVFYDRANIPILQTYLCAIEKKNDPQLNSVLYDGYRDIWNPKLHDFSKNGGSNDDLVQIFDGMMKFLEAGIDTYDNAAHWLGSILFVSPVPFDKCTPEQQGLFIDRFAQLVAKMATMEKAWKEAGKPMERESHVESMQKYLDFLRLPGNVVSLSGATVDGEAFDIEQYRGKVVVLHFWASWCGPCIRQIPLMKELYAQYHDRGFEVLGISYDFETEKVQPFIDKYELPYLSLFDKDRAILNRFSHGNSTIDLLIDREGKAVFYTGEAELHERLKEMFGE